MAYRAHPGTSIDRRRFVGLGIGAVAGAAILGPSSLRASEGTALLPSGTWGGIEALAEQVWAVASTPLASRDFKTVCNGGIVAGSERVLVVEAFAGREGARWVAEAAQELTGRRPTDVVITHYHGDHAGGLTGFTQGEERPTVHGTQTTLDRLRPEEGEDTPLARETRALLAAAHILDEGESEKLDLGGLEVHFHPRKGHTASDVTIELPEHDLGFAGDLVWNGMIPNFVDARPAQLGEALRAMAAGSTKTYVPGHGTLTGSGVVEANLRLLSVLEEAAHKALEAGNTAGQAAAETQLPDPFDGWVAFNPSYVERAIDAWMVDLRS